MLNLENFLFMSFLPLRMMGLYMGHSHLQFLRATLILMNDSLQPKPV